MSDSFIETTSEGWFSRIRESIKGFLFGLALFFFSFPFLWWNEQNSAETAAGLAQLQREAVTVSPDAVNPSHQGRPVHVRGQAETDEVLTDPEFGVSLTAVKLVRKVEMYQWEESEETESRRTLGGGKKRQTIYTYEKVWADGPIDSTSFHATGRAEHQNPPMPFRTMVIQARDVSLGAFKLSAPLVAQMEDQKPITLDARQRGSLPAALRRDLKNQGQGYDRGDPAYPRVGDLRIRFYAVEPGPVSVLARQSGENLELYVSKSGKSFGLLESGLRDKAAMIQTAQSKNASQTWLFRLAGTVMMFVGLLFVLNPLTVLADIVPFIGGLFESGVWLVSGTAAAGLSLLTISLAWVFQRPAIGLSVGLLAATVITAGCLQIVRRSRRRSVQPHVPAASPAFTPPQRNTRPGPIPYPAPQHPPVSPELYFACPSCSQHIRCEASYGGIEISCPSCTKPMVAPTAAAS